MTTTSAQYDVIIIGGGPAGMMAALSVKHHHPDYSVAILDKTHELGRKFLTSGAGRGNLTNVHLAENPAAYFHGDTLLITSIFSQFGYRDIMRFFDELGVPTYEEKKTSRGKIFPEIDHAKTVRDMLVDTLGEHQIEIFCNVDIITLVPSSDFWSVNAKDRAYTGRFIIMTAGGKTYPSLGADGSGYDLAASVGHTIVTPVVTAVPIVSKNQLSHFMQGEKMVMEATSIINGANGTTAVGDVMFTQYGFSGPAIFDISHDFSVRINRENKRDAKVKLSFFPNRTADEVRAILDKRLMIHKALPVAHSLWGLFTQKSAGAICAVAGLSKERLSGELSPQEYEKLFGVLTGFISEVTDTRGWNEGEFTAGGVATDEIDQVSLLSKKAARLFFAGEILNVDGQVGGFNLSWAWSSGWVAGKLLEKG